MKDRRGFTLLEIMIVIAIIGILGIVAVTNFQSWIYKYGFSGYQREVLSECREAKTRSVSSQRQHRVLLNLSTGAITVQRGGLGFGSDWQSGVQAVRPGISAPYHARIASVSYTPGSTSVTDNQVALIFNPSGEVMWQQDPSNNTIPVTQATIVLTGANAGDNATITVYGWTGKVRLN